MFAAPYTRREQEIHHAGFVQGYNRGYVRGCYAPSPTLMDSTAKATGYIALAAAVGFFGMKLLAPTMDTVLNH